MARRYKEARLLNNMMAAEAFERLNISRATLNAWEGERKAPSIESLEEMADLYGVTTDFLLGRTDTPNPPRGCPIDAKQLLIMNGQPVWSENHGWLLVHSKDQTLLSSDGTTIPFADSGPLFASTELTPDHLDLQKSPLSRGEIRHHTEIWLEPISSDAVLRQELRGWYRPRDLFVENESGSRFFYDSYGAKWLAFLSDAAL